MNAVGHFLDFRKTFSHLPCENVSLFLVSEIYLQMVKHFLSKKMKLQWNVILSVNYLNSINCCATLPDLQNVIPFHANAINAIIMHTAS